jgi:uncharacterized membrane protein (UPF0127 family)
MHSISRAESILKQGLFALTALVAGMSGAWASPTDGVPAQFEHTPLRIETAHGERKFDVQLAQSDAQQELGLMWVRILPVDQGMIFPMSPPRIASFWMKNTYIALDLLFLDSKGQIACIRTGVPLSLDIVTCSEPASGVLEIAGGQANAQRIRVGDKVVWGAPH